MLDTVPVVNEGFGFVSENLEPCRLISRGDAIGLGKDTYSKRELAENKIVVFSRDSPTVLVPSGSYCFARWCAPWFSKSADEMTTSEIHNVKKT